LWNIIELRKMVLKDFIPELFEQIRDIYLVSEEELKSPVRKKELVKARCAFAAIVRNFANFKYQAIAAELNRTDHTSAMHWYVEHLNWLETDQLYRQRFNMLHYNISKFFSDKEEDPKTYMYSTLKLIRTEVDNLMAMLVNEMNDGL
jgi:hypothetical protein